MKLDLVWLCLTLQYSSVLGSVLVDISIPIGQSYHRAHFLRACTEMCTISGGDDWAVVYCEGTWGVCMCVRAGGFRNKKK